jgi:hypothetical protein
VQPIDLYRGKMNQFRNKSQNIAKSIQFSTWWSLQRAKDHRTIWSIRVAAPETGYRFCTQSVLFIGQCFVRPWSLASLNRFQEHKLRFPYLISSRLGLLPSTFCFCLLIEPIVWSTIEMSNLIEMSSEAIISDSSLFDVFCWFFAQSRTCPRISCLFE